MNDIKRQAIETIKEFEVDAYNMCKHDKCTKDCANTIEVSKQWFNNNISKVTKFQNEQKWDSNYIYEDSKPLLDKVIEDGAVYKTNRL